MSGQTGMATEAGTSGRTTSVRTEPQRYSEYAESEPSGYGWVVFAGTMILMAGTLDLIYGIAAVAKSKFYVANTHYVFSDLNTWGWITLVIGAIMMCAGVGIFARAPWARWTGVAAASIGAIAQILSIAAYPWLAVAIFATEILVIYGLVVHGGREPGE
jgi:hypothetical protein